MTTIYIKSEPDQHQPDLVLSPYYVSGTIPIIMEIAVNKIDEVLAPREIEYNEKQLNK